MKRNLIIVCIFSLLAIAMLFSSCTCYYEGEEIRGCGYYCDEYGRRCESCNVGFWDCFCVGEGIMDKYRADKSYVGVEGVDYTTPTLTKKYADGKYHMVLSTDILKAYEEDEWKVNAEVCALQDGVQVGRFTVSVSAEDEGFWEVTTLPCADGDGSVILGFNKYYDPEGSEVEYFINYFYLIRDGGI